MRILIIIPTYNEKENIVNLIHAIFKLKSNIDILVVDDNSPDQTGGIVEQMTHEDSRIHLIRRKGKLGLGTAYIQGFKFALSRDYEYIFEMDADFSHDPKYIPDFLEKIKDYDLVLGSRYIQGVNVVNWPMSRLILSFAANLAARWVTGIPIRDCTGGFKCFRRKVLENIEFEKISSDGYSFQVEVNYKVWKKGFRICETSIIFVDRHAGTSKMSSRIVREAFLMLWKLRILTLFGRI